MKRAKRKMSRQEDDDFAPESSVAARLKEHGIDLSSDPYLMHCLGGVERSSCYYRSVSPKRVEEGTVDKGKYGWLDGDERLQPLLWPVDEGTDYREMISSRDEMGRMYELRDNVVGSDAKNTGLRYEYENISKGAARYDYVETERLLRTTEHEIFRQKSMALQDESGRGVSTLALDSELKSKYVEGERSLPSDPRLLDSDRLEVKGACYPDPHLLEKLTAMEMYGSGERLEFHSKNMSYPVEYTSQPRDLRCTCHIKGNAAEMSSGDYPPSSQDNMAMQKDIHPLTSAKFGNQLFLNEHREEFIFHAGRQKDVRSYYHDRCSASRTNDQEFLYPKTWPEEDYNHGYLIEGLNRRRDFYQLNVSPSRVLNTAKEKIDISQRNLIGCSSLDHHSSQTVLKYLPSSTFPTILHQDDFYQDSRETYAEKQNFRQREMPSLCISEGILNHGNDNDAELGRSLKRKYSLDNEMIKQDQKGQDAGLLLLPMSLEQDIEQCRKVCKAYEKEKVNPVAASHNLLSSHNLMEQGQKLLINQNEPWKKQKVYQKPSSLSWHNMSQHNTKHSLPKNVWVRGNIDKQMEVHENKVKESKTTLVDSEKSVLPEGPNKFDLQVQKFFLFFTKKVNEDLTTRKRYKEKGRAGGLFCIACGKRYVSSM